MDHFLWSLIASRFGDPGFYFTVHSDSRCARPNIEDLAGEYQSLLRGRTHRQGRPRTFFVEADISAAALSNGKEAGSFRAPSTGEQLPESAFTARHIFGMFQLALASRSCFAQHDMV